MWNEDKEYTMTSDEQLFQWVNGNSIHNGDREAGWCCPDFSCCKPELKASESDRKLFFEATEEIRMSMLMMFLGKLIPLATDKKVYITGDDPGPVC